MARRAYTFLPPPSRQRGFSLQEEDFEFTYDIPPPHYRHQSISVSDPSHRRTRKSGSVVSKIRSKMQSREIIVSPGNILSKTSTWRKGNETAPEELYESLKSCLEQQQKEIEASAFTNGNYAEIVSSTSGSNEVGENRSELKVTVKIFLYSAPANDILSAIQQGLKNASVEYLDTLVISFAGQSEASRLTLEHVQNVWTVLEGTVKTGLVKMIGLCDVDPQLFIQVYEWATVKPSIVQINLASCCVVPPELAGFCKEHDIQLLTHSDPINILPEDKLETLVKPLQTLVGGSDGKPAKFDTKWALRYQVHVKCRGVLAIKGYVLSIESIQN